MWTPGTSARTGTLKISLPSGWRTIIINGASCAWLGPGARETLITGDGPDWEKFLAFARALPQAAGSPVATWCHMELRHYFGYTGVLNEQTARQVWARAARRLHRPDFGVQGLLARSRVRYLATTDDPADDLRYHLAWQRDPALNLILSPTFRPDRALDCTKPDWPRYLARLAEAAGCGTDTLAGIQQALLRRMDAFAAAGCRASDHALSRLTFAPCDARQAAALYHRALAGRTLTPRQAARLQTHLLLFCGRGLSAAGLGHAAASGLPAQCQYRPGTGAGAGYGL